MATNSESIITIDTAQRILIAALEGRLTENRVALGWTTIEDVERIVASRYERLVGFDLATPDGTRKTFVATIRESDEDDE